MDQDDLRDLRDTILTEMRLGFAGVYARQDKTNGRVLGAETRLTKTEERIRVIFRRISERRFIRRDGDPVEEDAGPFRRRYPMKVLVPSVAGAAIALFEALQHIVPAVLELFK